MTRHPPENAEAIPRFVPDLPLPPYAFVPGRFPHPTSDPAGHSFGMPRERADPPDPTRWESCRPYLQGVDLFNHGYFWEAHEAWEALWQACGRRGLTADFLKGLIKLAAAGVKAREGKPAGVRSHARRAAELFRRTQSQLVAGPVRYMGLTLAELIEHADRMDDRLEDIMPAPDIAAVKALGFILCPKHEPTPDDNRDNL